MAGRKLFTNQSPYALLVTLTVRRNDDPRNAAGTKEFHILPRQSQWQEYGDNINIYLNGITIAAQGEGVAATQQHTVIVRGSALDNELNTRNGVDIGFDNDAYFLSTRQVN